MNRRWDATATTPRPLDKSLASASYLWAPNRPNGVPGLTLPTCCSISTRPLRRIDMASDSEFKDENPKLLDLTRRAVLQGTSMGLGSIALSWLMGEEARAA